MVKSVVKRLPVDVVASLGKIDKDMVLAIRFLLREHANRPPELTSGMIRQAAKEGAAEAIMEARG